MATWCKKLTHLKRPWCWEILKVGEEVDDRGWDDWIASPSQWTWVWVSSGSWWWTGKPGMSQSMGLQRVRQDWVTELNLTESHYRGPPSGIYLNLITSVAQMVKHLSTMWETQVWSLGREVPWRRKWQSTPVLLPGKSHGQRSLVGYSPWGRKESDTTEWSSP